MITDKILGMITGACLGDAMGMPFERKRLTTDFDGKIQQYTHRSRFQGTKRFQLGQLSDDGEMTIVLINSLVENKGVYDEEIVLKNYLEWANSGNPCMGKNTRNLLYGVKTVKGYKNRVAKHLDTQEKRENMRSNGSIMRCSILSILPEKERKIASKLDCYLTNPSKFCLKIEEKYLSILHMALSGCTKKEIFSENTSENTENICEMPEIDVTYMKGWCGYGPYLGLYALKNTKNFQEGIEWIIRQGGDTDTNACIGGALLGAFYGLKKMEKNPVTFSNIEILRKCDTKTSDKQRPEKYTFSSGIENLKKLIELRNLT